MSLTTVTGWEYQSGTNTIPPDPSAVTVPSAGYTGGGIMPFGDVNAYVPAKVVQTVWSDTTALWVRQDITTDGLKDVIFTGIIDRNCYLYIDGTFVAQVNAVNADLDHEFNIVVPKEILDDDVHEIAFYCLDIVSFEDATAYFYVEADYAPTTISLQPEAPMEEVLEWLTSVTVSHDGTEDRDKVVDAPRQTFQLTYPAPALKKAYGYNVFWGGKAQKWLVPVWSQAQYLGAVAADLWTIPGVTPDYTEFRDASLAILWQSWDNWQVVGIDTVEASSLILTAPVNASGFAGAWLIPVRYAFIPEKIDRITTGLDDKFVITFEVLDIDQISPTTPTQYAGDDIYVDETLIETGSIVGEIERSMEVFDPGRAGYAFYENWTNSREKRNRNVFLTSPAEIWNYRDFLYRRAGRWRQYWEPTFENNLRLVSTGTITTSIVISDDSYTVYSERDHISILASDGTWYHREITGLSDAGGGNTSLTLDSAVNIEAAEVKRICWLGLKRFDTDKVSFTYAQGLANSSVATVEIAP